MYERWHWTFITQGLSFLKVMGGGVNEIKFAENYYCEVFLDNTDYNNNTIVLYKFYCLENFCCQKRNRHEKWIRPKMIAGSIFILTPIEWYHNINISIEYTNIWSIHLSYKFISMHKGTLYFEWIFALCMHAVNRIEKVPTPQIFCV